LKLPTDDDIKTEFTVYLSDEEHEDTLLIKPVKPKEKKPHVNRQIFVILPFSEPRKHDCGKFLEYNLSHVSVRPDFPNDNGELEHSIHPQRARRVNCNSIACEYCNFRHDSNGELELDAEGNRIPYGTYESTIFYQEQKIRNFQERSLGIIKSRPYPENFRRLHKLFYSRHRTNHASGDVFYTLVDKKMGPKQLRNLNNTLLYASKRNVPLNIYHHVLSPPSDWTGWDTEDGMKNNTSKAIDLLREVGCFGGYIYFHPFRIPDKFNDRVECAEGPHWHFVGFAHIMADVEKTIFEREKVVIKALHHANGHVEPVKSVRKTLAYILSHVGVQIYKEPILTDLILLETYHYINSEKPANRREPSSFMLPRGETNFEDRFHFPIDPLIIPDETFKDSLSYFTFLKTADGRTFTLMRRNILSILEGEDQRDYSKYRKSNNSKKGKKILMRNFGILSNSKNFIWGFKREKPKFYCGACKTEIPVALMFPGRVLTESLIGIKGPPDTDDQTPVEDMDLIALLDRTERRFRTKIIKERRDRILKYHHYKNMLYIDPKSAEKEKCEEAEHFYEVFRYELGTMTLTSDDILFEIPPEDVGKYYSEVMDGDRPTGIYRIPLQFFKRLDIDLETVHRHYYRTRRPLQV
jgi:hypothetical protein